MLVDEFYKELDAFKAQELAEYKAMLEEYNNFYLKSVYSNEKMADMFVPIIHTIQRTINELTTKRTGTSSKALPTITW